MFLRSIILVLMCFQLNCFTKASTNIEDAEDDCDDDSLFAHGEEQVYRDGTCDFGFTRVQILNPRIEEIYTTICHNEDQDWTLWALHLVDGPKLSTSPTTPRPDNFLKDDFYKRQPRIKPRCSYQIKQQNDSLTRLLGSKEQAAKYIDIDQSKQLFLVRGHLSPFADHVTGDAKNSTFYYINVFPQWQIINNRNWGKIETNIRTKAITTGSLFFVYTGTYGVTTLLHVDNTPVEFWLGRQSTTGPVFPKLPVNKLVWKVIYDGNTQSAVAVITVNNPHMPYTVGDEICTDVCNQVPWVLARIEDINKKNIKYGYTYCCTVASFRAAVPYAPDYGNLPLLR